MATAFNSKGWQCYHGPW